MKATLEDIFAAIRREREYQTRKWGSVQEHPHEVASYCVIMQGELDEAMQAWRKGRFGHEDLQEVLQVVAVGVACLEQHGIVEREELAEVAEVKTIDETLFQFETISSYPLFYSLERTPEFDRWCCKFLALHHGGYGLSSVYGATKAEAIANSLAWIITKAPTLEDAKKQFEECKKCREWEERKRGWRQ